MEEEDTVTRTWEFKVNMRLERKDFFQPAFTARDQTMAVLGIDNIGKHEVFAFDEEKKILSTTITVRASKRHLLEKFGPEFSHRLKQSLANNLIVQLQPTQER